jgi:hypothetical protein
VKEIFKSNKSNEATTTANNAQKIKPWNSSKLVYNKIQVCFECITTVL